MLSIVISLFERQADESLNLKNFVTEMERVWSRLTGLERISMVMVAVLLLCLAPLPYGFYTVVRLAVAIVAACWAYKFFNSGQRALGIVACGVVLLFQPLLKITMDRVTWNVLDVILAIALLILVFGKNFKIVVK